VRILNFFLNLFRFDRTNWRAVSLCVLVAGVFWVFNALNKQYSTNIRFPLLFEFDGEKYAIAKPLPKSINLNVTGNGWDLFRKHFGMNVSPVIVPLEHPNETPKIVGSTVLPLLASQVGNLTINFVMTDTLHIKIDKKDFHRYKLTTDISGLRFREGYGRTSRLVVLPDSVRIEGPESILHALADSITLKVSSQPIDEDFRQEIEITFPGSEMVRRNPPIAQVMFEVAEIKTVEMKLKITNTGQAHLLHDSVKAVFQIPAAQLSEFSEESKKISAQVDLKKTKNMNPVPQVLSVPVYARLLSIDSLHWVNQK